jgi:hypothetical protein
MSKTACRTEATTMQTRRDRTESTGSTGRGRWWRGSERSGTKKNAVVGLREKKIADGKRSTTPATKYERARVLGTRALQIRYALDHGPEGSSKG